MRRLIGLTGLATLLLVTYLVLWAPDNGADRSVAHGQVQAGSQAPDRASGAQLPGELPASPGVAQRESVPAGPAAETPLSVKPETRASDGPTIRGIVVDLEGQGLARVEVCQSIAGGPCATSDAGGTFTIQVTHPGKFEVRSESLVTVATGSVPLVGAAAMVSADEPQLAIIASPAVVFAGVVVAEDGTNVGAAHLSLKLPDELLQTLGWLATATQRVYIETLSSGDGTFRFDRAPSGVALWVEASGFVPHFARLPRAGAASLVVVLRRLELGPDTLVGQVVDATGIPVEGAQVSAGSTAVATDADGLFRLSKILPRGLPSNGDVKHIAAVKSGFLPARVALPAAGADEFIQLVLEGVPFSIQGKVLNDRGDPVQGILVQPWNRTPFGAVTEEAGLLRPVDIEQLLAGSGGLDCRTDAEGAFTVGGLLDREYQLEAVDEAHLIATRTAPIAAGARSVVIRLASAAAQTLEGRIVRIDGQPAAGVQVTAMLPTAYEGTGDDSFGMVMGPSLTTGADGRFRLEGIGREGVVFNLLGESMVPQFMVEPPAAPLPIELVVARRCELRIRRAAPGPTLTGTVFDRKGRALPVFFSANGGWHQQSTFVVPADGAVQVFSVSELAAALVLRDGPEEKQRIPLTLDPTGANEISID